MIFLPILCIHTHFQRDSSVILWKEIKYKQFDFEILPELSFILNLKLAYT